MIWSSAPPECPLPDILPACSAALPKCLPASVNLAVVDFGEAFPTPELPVIPLLLFNVELSLPAVPWLVEESDPDELVFAPDNASNLSFFVAEAELFDMSGKLSY